MTDTITRARNFIAKLWELRRECERVSPDAVGHLEAAIAAAEADLAQAESEQLRDQLRLSFYNN